MNIYIWKRRALMTDSYHAEGGAVAIAESLEAARKQLVGVGKYPNIPDESEALTTDPDIVLPVPDDAEKYAEVFPDAGCC